MKLRSLIALAVLTASPSALGQGAQMSTAGPATGLGQPDAFAAPNGQLGAGLSISRVEGARAYGELGFYTTGFSFGPIDISVTSLSLLVGGGYKIAPDIEIEAMLPLAYGVVSVDSSDPDVTIDGDDSDSGFGVGNLHVGASYIRADGPLRMKIGGAVEYGPWTIDPSEDFEGALTLADPAYAGQDIGLWQFETLGLVTPARVEYGDQLVATGDGGFGLYIPTDGRDADFTIQINPGVGYYATPTVLVGGRLPFIWVPTRSGDNTTQFALEPFARFDFGTAFANVRFTLNLDDPYGFAFDEGKFWGLHIGGGGRF